MPFRVADIVKVKHSILGINEFMRIVEVKTIRDAENNIVKTRRDIRRLQ